MAKYFVALAVGGLPEQPHIEYQDIQEIEATDSASAVQLYNKKNKCSFFYGTVISAQLAKKILNDPDKYRK